MRHSEIEWNTLDAEYVKQSCAKDTTVNSCLIGMLLQEHPEYKRIGIPVSIREENRGMSNQTSGLEIVYRFREKLSFEDNVKNIHKAIYKRINNQNMKYFILMFIPPKVSYAKQIVGVCTYQNERFCNFLW